MYLRCLFCVNSFRDLNTVLGNKKVELFDSAGEPTAEENVHMASCESLSTSVECFQMIFFGDQSMSLLLEA